MNPTALVDRRGLLRSVAATATASACATLPGMALAQAAARGTDAARPLLDAFAEEILVLNPTTATGLGLDTGARAGLKALLDDASPTGQQRWAQQVRSMKTRLAGVNRSGLDDAARTRLDAVAYATDRGIDGLAFRYGGGAAAGFGGGTSPYVVSQQSGAVTGVPEFLDSQHQIRTKADADAYLSRMQAMARAIDQESAQITADAAIGVMPPAFVAKTVLGQLRGYRGTPAAAQKIVTSLAERTAKAGIGGDWQARAVRLVDTAIYPAIDRQIAAFAAATASAPMDAGVQRLPDGDAYYRWALRLGTTTTQTAAEIHRIGLEQNAALKARMDVLLKAQGLTKGSVGERVVALNRDPKFLFPDTDEGRAQLIAYLNGRLAAIRPLMPQLSHMALKADVTIKRVPADIQDGAALGYMNFASLDGSRPAIYYVNLKSTSLWPKYQLATLTAHEGLPGHAWQGAYLAEHHDEIPLITSLTGFNAFTEGWALYAEQLVDEHGLYADDPFGQIGYLQAQQFRACRLVADTGLHAMRWTRDRTVKFLVDETGKGADAMTSETDRYCVAPGQACGYKTGHNEIVRLRDKAKATLGAKFDLAAFDDVVVQTGGVPLTILAQVVDAHIARTRGG